MQVYKMKEKTIIVDATSPLLERPEHLKYYREGGVTCVSPTIAAHDSAMETFRTISAWLELLRGRDDLLLVQSGADIERAYQTGKLGILFHFQGTAPFEGDTDLVPAFAKLGVRVVMLTYNTASPYGDGCEEPRNGGLTRLGSKLIGCLEHNGILLDLSHTGYRTTMEAMSTSTKPVVFTHSNAYALHPSPRNIRDDQVRAAAETGGMVGVTAVPYLIKSGAPVTMDDFIDHISHFCDLVGTDHVGLGMDYYWGQQPFASDELAYAIWKSAVEKGVWDPSTYPEPPHYYPQGLETPAQIHNLPVALERRGFDRSDITKIMGENWHRVYSEVFPTL